MMRAYFLETPLSDQELVEVQELMEDDIEQIQIPYVLPAADESGSHADRPLIDEELASKPLRTAGILRDYGKRVLLVMPEDMHWYTAFAHAVRRLTGFYPFLVQTEAHRRTRAPGPLRIVDMDKMMEGL